MGQSKVETQINFHEDVLESEESQSDIVQWNTKGDTSILIDPSQAISHRKFIRRWNRLSRLQRSVVYALILIAVTVLVLLYSSKIGTTSKDIKIVAEELKNVSHVIEPAVTTPPKKSVVESEQNERPVFTGPTSARQYAVVRSFKHAWSGYREHAWGHDNLKPVSGMAYDWFSLGLTIVDSLDTAYIMGLTEEYEQGKEWIKNELVFTKNKDVNFFEVTIRVLGALLTNYHFTQDELFINKAKDLGERLMAAFSSPSGIPYSDVNLGTRTAHAPEWSHYSTTAEVTTVQLEFRQLSRATNNPMFEDAAAAVSEKIHGLPKKHGLVPIFINPNTGHFLPHATITLGARGDSYYEYLLKQWLQTGKTINYFSYFSYLVNMESVMPPKYRNFNQCLLDDYMTAIEGVREFLAKRSSPSKHLFIGELSAGSEAFNPKMDHLTCFLPGTLALGHANGLPDWHMTMAEELLHTCYLTYAAHPTFLAPEITHFNLASTTSDMYTKAADTHSLLRPEFVESLWYMYQITGNTTYQDWGWQIFQGFEKYAKVSNGYTSLGNVKSEKPVPRDMMESFFLSETLKYLYLLFSNDSINYRYRLDFNMYCDNKFCYVIASSVPHKGTASYESLR